MNASRIMAAYGLALGGLTATLAHAQECPP